MLKLFVVGQSSPDPDEWLGRYRIVIAGNSEEAEALGMCSPATELPMNEPMEIAQGEGGYGDE